MKAHGMLYSADMVLADLRGDKLQTRRPVTFENSLTIPPIKRKDWKKVWSKASIIRLHDPSPTCDIPFIHVELNKENPDVFGYGLVYKIYPRVQPGDTLWFKETFWLPHRYPSDGGGDQDFPPSMCKGRPVHYDADGPPPNTPNETYPEGLRGGAYAAPDPWAIWHKHPSIHMPQWASRISHIVPTVRLQRIQDISDADCIAEGALTASEARSLVPRAYFEELWDSKYGDGPHAWKNNGLIWVYDYEVKS